MSLLTMDITLQNKVQTQQEVNKNPAETIQTSPFYRLDGYANPFPAGMKHLPNAG